MDRIELSAKNTDCLIFKLPFFRVCVCVCACVCLYKYVCVFIDLYIVKVVNVAFQAQPPSSSTV